MRLTLVIASLGRGGAERTASVLANAWAEQGIHVTLITYLRDDVPSYPLHAGIVLRQMQLRGGAARHFLHGMARNLKVVRALRRAIRESAPDIIVSFMDIPNVLTLLATRGMDVPLVVNEQNHPAYYRIGWIWETMRRLVYHHADTLVCSSKPLLDWFQSAIKVRGCTIPNPVEPALLHPPLAATEHGDTAGRVMVGMGRLVEQKGFDLLLEAFSQVSDRHPDWSLKILGDGPLKDQLRAQAQKLGLAGRTEFTGALTDPFPVLRAADLFVFSSRYEGFGNALCEALACGVPAISFDCPSGPSDIIRHEVDGLLVPAKDVTALAAAMDRLMSNTQERLRLASRASEVVSRFGTEQILVLWQRLFDDLLADDLLKQRKVMRSQ